MNSKESIGNISERSEKQPATSGSVCKNAEIRFSMSVWRKLKFVCMNNFKKISVLICLIFLTACQSGIFKTSEVAPAALRDVPAVRLNFRYEPDVPAPAEDGSAQTEELNPAVRADFEANRSSEVLSRTIVSPNKQRILAAYYREGDIERTFRLDMYDGSGKFLRRVTPDPLAVVFPDSIVWSPDSANVAFAGLTREGGLNLAISPEASENDANSNISANSSAGVKTNTNSAETTTEVPAASKIPLPDAPPNVLTFRTEQIYLCTSEGTDLKPLTQTEGLIYYYFVWSPDSSMLAALAAKLNEWRFLENQARQAGEKFVPVGRPRILEKNGRERILDDGFTKVYPVWSPDSAKVAVAFDKSVQVRIYDAIGNSPTQAAIPLRNLLLISSQEYDRRSAVQSAPAENVNSSTEVNANQGFTTLPDERNLVSFQPIIKLEWAADNLLYFQTGYVREFVNSAENRYSSLRWHRLVFSPQSVTLGNKP